MHTKTEHPEALPIVPQIHCAFLYFTEEFKAALQLRPGAVGPQSPHVHHSSLLLLVKRTDSAGGKRLKGGVLFFLSPFSFLHRAPNELVLITPVDTAGDFGGPPLFLSLFSICLLCSLCDWFSLLPLIWLSCSLEAPSICLGTTIPLSLCNSSSRGRAIFIKWCHVSSLGLLLPFCEV